MYLLQKVYSIILNFVLQFTSKIDEKNKYSLISLSCIGLLLYFIWYFTPAFSHPFRWKLTFNTFICSTLLFVITVCASKGELKPARWNKALFYLFFLSGAGIVAISFLHPIGSGYRAWGMLMMFGFPCVYYVWNNRGDYCMLYTRLSAATIIVGISFYIYCFVLASRGFEVLYEGRMKGPFYDSNMFSMIGMIMVCCSLYMLLVNRHNKAWFALTALGFGIGTDIVFLGASRLSILIIAGSLFAFTIFYIKCREEMRKGRSHAARLIRAEILLISLIVFMFAGKVMTEVNIRVIADNSAHKIASAETFVETGSDDTEIDALNRFNPEGQDLNSYTAGRVNIWKNYAKYLNMTGNDFSKADWNSLTGNTVKHAHNNFLEIGFRCGVPVAILHTLLEVAAGIICIIYLFGRKYRNPSYLFSIVFMIMYAVQSLFDIATIPFERPAPFFFYMAMIPIFMFGTEKES